MLHLLVNDEFVTDFLVKANLFNDFFREQCRPITNDSSLPNNQILESVTRLYDFNIDIDTIIKLICSLDPNKAQGCDRILIHMLKCYVNFKTSTCSFNNGLMNECFQNEWKKANIVPVHKKGDEQVNNYQPVSLFPICSKLFLILSLNI